MVTSKPESGLKEKPRSSAFRLVRFLLWYGLVVAVLFQLLPVLAEFVQDQYEAMAGSFRLVSIIGFFCVTGIWQIIHIRNRMEQNY
jgi:hypothetical protein